MIRPGWFSREVDSLEEDERRSLAGFLAEREGIRDRLRADQGVGDLLFDSLVRSFAHLSARVQRRFARHWLGVEHALIDAVSPGYTRPIPPLAVAALEADSVCWPSSDDTLRVRKGEVPVKYSSGWESVRLLPIDVVRIERLDLARLDPAPTGATGDALRIELRVTGPISGEELAADPYLPVFLGAQIDVGLRLQPLLLEPVSDRLWSRAGGDWVEGRARPTTRLRTPTVVGERRLDLLDYPKRAFEAYRLLSEFFAFPEAHLFVDLPLPVSSDGLAPNQTIELVVPMASGADVPDLDPRAVRTRCVPVAQRVTTPVKAVSLARGFEVDLHGPGLLREDDVLLSVRNVEGAGRGQSYRELPVAGREPHGGGPAWRVVREDGRAALSILPGESPPEYLNFELTFASPAAAEQQRSARVSWGTLSGELVAFARGCGVPTEGVAAAPLTRGTLTGMRLDAPEQNADVLRDALRVHARLSWQRARERRHEVLERFLKSITKVECERLADAAGLSYRIELKDLDAGELLFGMLLDRVLRLVTPINARVKLEVRAGRSRVWPAVLGGPVVC